MVSDPNMRALADVLVGVALRELKAAHSEKKESHTESDALPKVVAEIVPNHGDRQ